MKKDLNLKNLASYKGKYKKLFFLFCLCLKSSLSANKQMRNFLFADFATSVLKEGF